MCKPRIDCEVSIAYCYSSSGDDVDCLGRMLRCDWLVFSSFDWCISILDVSVYCSLSGPLSQGSLVFVSWSWVSMLPEFLFHYPCWCSQGKILSESRLWPCICTNEIRIHKLYFLPKGAVSGDFCLFLSGEVWVRASWMSRLCSLIRSCTDLPVSPIWTERHSQGILETRSSCKACFRSY